VGNFKFAL